MIRLAVGPSPLATLNEASVRVLPVATAALGDLEHGAVIVGSACCRSEQVARRIHDQAAQLDLTHRFRLNEASTVGVLL